MAKKEIVSRLEKVLLTHWPVTLFLVVLFLRLPSLFEPFTYGDEGIYVTLGQAIKNGLVLYRDIHDNKPPLLYLLAGLAGNFEYFRLILFVWSLVTIFAFYRLARLLFSKNEVAVMASTGVFAILSSSHTFEGNVANAENFMLLPIIFAFSLILPVIKKEAARQKSGQNVSLWFLAGLLFSSAALFKIPAAFDFLGLMALMFLIFGKKKLVGFASLAFPAAAGFLAPILATFVYYASQGALGHYLVAVFSQNIPYLSSWIPGDAQIGGLSVGLMRRGLVVLLIMAALYALRKRVSFGAKVAVSWFAFSWLGTVLSSRPYPHYLLQLIPAFSLSFGLVFAKKAKFAKEKLVPLALLVVLMITFVHFRFWHYANLPYYLNFYQFALGAKSQEQYYFDFDQQAAKVYSVADYLKSRTLPNEKIFIWGNDPFLYALTRRLPVGRYTTAYHIIDFNGYQETLEALAKNPPRYLIVTHTESRPFPGLEALIENDYLLESKINSTRIFHRRPNMPNSPKLN